MKSGNNKTTIQKNKSATAMSRTTLSVVASQAVAQQTSVASADT